MMEGPPGSSERSEGLAGSSVRSRRGLLHLDVFVDDRDPQTGILELLSRLRPQWKEQDIQMKVFTEGITNQLRGCYVGPGGLQDPQGLPGDCVLVRVYGRMTELFVDRDKELDMLQLFHAHGSGPQLYCSFTNGICYQFTRGVALEDRLLRQPHIYRLIAEEMGRIHSIQTQDRSTAQNQNQNQPQPLLWTKMNQFMLLLRDHMEESPGTLPDGGVDVLPSFQMLSNEMETLKAHLSLIGSPMVLCHNDLLTKNIIYNQTEGTVKFIDYEYADYNYQAFDIGNHFNEFCGVTSVDPSLYPPPDLQKDWLTFYLQSYRHSRGHTEVSVTQEEVTALYVTVCKYSLASNFFWGLWAMLQARYSTIDFDFQRYAKSRLDHYFQKKEEYFRLTLS